MTLFPNKERMKRFQKKTIFRIKSLRMTKMKRIWGKESITLRKKNMMMMMMIMKMVIVVSLYSPILTLFPVRTRADTDAASNPFEVHFTGPGDGELSQKVQSISEKKWKSSKKEFPDNIRLVRAVPDITGSNASLLPAMKHTANAKVSRHDSRT